MHIPKSVKVSIRFHQNRSCGLFALSAKNHLTGAAKKGQSLTGIARAHLQISHRKLCTAVFILMVNFLYAQVTTTRNYVLSNTILKPGITTQTQINALTYADRNQTVNYFDGLGRPVQTVLTQGNPAYKDIITPVEYDGYGREIKKFLPYADLSVSSYGSLRTTAYADQKTFYDPATTTNSLTKDLYPFTQLVTEFSPLSRPKENGAPGQTWQPGNGHTIKSLFLLNTATDDVKRWNVSYVANDFGSYTVAGVFAAGDLFKTITADENGKQVIEFKDREGKILLKKVQLNATNDNGNGSGYLGWLCTYYIYDDFNNLRCVIQPKGVEFLSTNSWTNCAPVSDATILSEQCFRYEYDARGRMIMKKVPGAAAVQMVYDARNRLVMMQDGNLRTTQQWLVTVYENDFNRPVYTYKITDPSSSTTDPLNAANAANHRTAAYSGTSYPTVASYSNELLTETHYDDYSSLPSGFSTSLINSGYSAYLNAPASDNPDPLTVAGSAKGRVTWTKLKVLNENTFIITCNLYDEKGRVIQVQSLNYTGAMDVVTNQYSFSGLLLRSHIKHQMGTSNVQIYEVGTKNSYDYAGRLTMIEKNINGGGWKAISSLQYDELGQLKTKILSPSFGGGTGLETLTYDYNIRGWLLGENRDYVKDVNSTNYFGFDLGYDKSGVIGTYTPEYNGNIAGMIWKSKGDGAKRKYDFSYDAVNRLTGADFNQWVSGSGSTAAFDKSAGIDYSVSNLTYDANGNILTQNQKGWKVGGSSFIDQLSYSYTANSNKLLQVTDASNDNTSRLGDFKYDPATKTATDYSYDGNGNLTLDNNKKISSIAYNYLNLPQTITVTGKGTISYVYDAAGNKLEKITVDNTVSPAKTTTTLYLFGTYENDVLQFLPMEEGRIRPVRDINNNITSFTYDYFLKDHLGNVRMVLTEEQKTDAYPPASMETAQSTAEEAIYSNVSTTRFAKSSITGYPTDTYTSPNDYVAKTNGSGNKIGPAMILKVMAGDQFNIRVSSWYKLNGATPGTPISPLTDLLTALTNGIGTLAGSKATTAELQANNTLNNPATSFLTAENGYTTTKPKAFINWILFDEQFNYVSSSSGFEQVGADQEFKIHQFNGLAVNKNGYLYIYVSNETPNIDVFFDNLQVTHIRGPLTQDQSYYPFGLIQQGISSSSVGFGNPNNKMKYNGKEEQRQEFSDGSGLEWLDYGARMYDNQIGRFFTVDPMSEKFYFETPYNYGGNSPVNNIDVDGRFKLPTKFQKKYARLAKYLQKNGIDQLLKSKIILDAFKNYGRLTPEQLKKDFAWNSGPNIKIVNEPGPGLPGSPQGANGYYDGITNTIQLSSKLVKILENAKNEDLQAALLAVIATLLHEENHRGEELAHVHTDEPGDAFVNDVYSLDIEDNGKMYKVVDLDFNDPIWDKDAEEKILRGAHRIIDNKSQTEEGKKVLPTMTWSQFNGWLNHALEINPDINVSFIN